jgi:hypothetical protein
MSPAKLDRFEAAGRPREVDSKGHEVVSEGRFYEDADVLQMYYFCSTLRVSNRVYLEDDEDAEYILDLLESPLYARILEADKVGPRVLLRRILGFMDSFYSKDVQFRARSHGRVSGFDRMQKITAMFNRRAFKDFKLSDDAVEDVYVFLSLFGEAA